MSFTVFFCSGYGNSTVSLAYLLTTHLLTPSIQEKKFNFSIDSNYLMGITSKISINTYIFTNISSPPRLAGEKYFILLSLCIGNQKKYCCDSYASRWNGVGTSAERRSEEMLTNWVNVTSVSEEILSSWVLVLDWIYCMMSKLFIVSCLTK